jgi:hypothetical protein
VLGPKKIGVKLNLAIVELSGEWEPDDVERMAAWELYVELITRVSVVPLASDEGLMREALTSLHSMFGSTREVLRRYGPDVASPKLGGQFSLGFLAVTILNAEIRPLLSAWHPALADWETHRPIDISPLAHEQAWPRSAELRTVLDTTRGILAVYAGTLAVACGVPNLIGAPNLVVDPEASAGLGGRKPSRGARGPRSG